ncbi:MAG: hypothetical protein ACP5E3_16830 [Bacteroidales bacterium]
MKSGLGNPHGPHVTFEGNADEGPDIRDRRELCSPEPQSLQKPKALTSVTAFPIHERISGEGTLWHNLKGVIWSRPAIRSCHCGYTFRSIRYRC